MNQMNQYNNNNNINQDESMWIITDEDEFKYQKLFSNTRDLNEKVSIQKLNEMFEGTKMNPEVTKKILSLLPHVYDGYPYNFFRIIFHLLYKSLQGEEIPNTLPRILTQGLNLQEYNQTGNQFQQYKPDNVNVMQSTTINLVESYDNHPKNLNKQPELKIKIESEQIQPIQQQFTNLDNLDVGDKEISKILEDIIKACKSNELITQKNNETREKILDVRKRIIIEKDKLTRLNNNMANKLEELSDNQGNVF